MVFRRRDKRSLTRTLRDSLWPRGGWARSFHYIRHRLTRLPDQPHRIARGVFVGIFVSFTPFFGIHLVVAALLAKLIRGNVLASLFATLVGNPLTFPLIALVSIKLGHWMLGQSYDPAHAETLLEVFAQAFADTRHNLIAIFTRDEAHWAGMEDFFKGVFLPYTLGGLIPGILAGLTGYYIALPIVTAYQNRRRLRLKERLAKLKAKLPHRSPPEPETKAETKTGPDHDPAKG